MDTKGLGLVVLVVLVIGIGAVVGFVPTLEHNVDVQENEPVEAIVVETDLEVREDSDGDEEYNPVVVYEYAVDGETYRSDNTYPGSFTRWTSSRSDAEAVVDAHPEGATVTVSYRPDDPTRAYLTNDGWPGGWFVGVGAGVVAAAGGGWLLRKGFRRWRQRNLIKNTPTERVQSLSIGPSEITGTAVCENGDPLVAPFSDDDCVLASYEIKEYDTSGDNNSWKTKAEGVEFRPFHVDDGTGSVLVEPHEDATFDLDPDDWTERYVDSAERGPAPIRRFVESRDDLGYPSDARGKSNDRKYRQNLIRPGEDVYVFGTVQPRDTELQAGVPQEDRLVVRKVSDDSLSEPMYLISDDTATELKARRRFALWRAPVGALFLVIAFSFLLGTFAPQLGLELPVWI